jgi:hypothetical protein
VKHEQPTQEKGWRWPDELAEFDVDQHDVVARARRRRVDEIRAAINDYAANGVPRRTMLPAR